MYLYELVGLFPPNDKSMLRLTYKKEVLFFDRVDYLQYNKDGVLDPICNKEVAFWYVPCLPVDPETAQRDTNNWIIVPNYMNVILYDCTNDHPVGLYQDIPKGTVTLRDLIKLSAWLSFSYVELIGEDDDNETDLIKTNELLADMRFAKGSSYIGLREQNHLPDDIYDRKVVGLDLSHYYIDPEKVKPDSTGKYSEPKPRLTITVEGSLYNDR